MHDMNERNAAVLRVEHEGRCDKQLCSHGLKAIDSIHEDMRVVRRLIKNFLSRSPFVANALPGSTFSRTYGLQGLNAGFSTINMRG